jgi:hypothetical protein
MQALLNYVHSTPSSHCRVLNELLTERIAPQWPQRKIGGAGSGLSMRRKELARQLISESP